MGFPAIHPPGIRPGTRLAGFPAWVMLACLALGTAGPGSAAVAPALVWDSLQKDRTPAPGVFDVPFTFHVTNVSRQEVWLKSVRTSCGCSTARLPGEPFRLGPGRSAPVQVTLDLRGRGGTLFKAVTVETSVGDQVIWTRVEIPPETTAGTAISTRPGVGSTAGSGTSVTRSTGAPGVGAPAVMAAGDRDRNLRLAQADRQAVFKGDCRRCHVEPGRDQYGRALYVAACAICHDAPHRNAVVPDLRQARVVRDLRYWKAWITEGRDGSLMPAFGAAAGGPLTPDQVSSLAVYLLETFPRAPRASPPAAVPGAAQRP